ncbi:MAG TPA: DUF349 domain-containing protein [Actinobacteria bacterium]|nr:DUF349 domain-containing protein [Actinomycetota bacterium]
MAENGVPTPAALRPPTPVSAARVPSPAAPAAPTASNPAAFGHVDPDGTVHLHAPEGDIVVGQWAAGDPSEGLAFFGRKYDDLVVEVELVSVRLADGRASGEQADSVVTKVREALAARSFVGDVRALEAKCDALAEAAALAREANRARRAAEREAALADRRRLADEAESLSGSTAWKATTERYAALVEEWKVLPRGDRAAEQELWKRISAARTSFDKRRRAHFSELDTQRKDIVAGKRALIERAEGLATSTDWQRTGKQLRDLLDEWKALPRASRSDEDRLWKRFKAAQDAFYAARTAAQEASEEELRVHVPAKEALLTEAEALLPVTDLAAAKKALRGIQDRWEKAGDVPRSERGRLEGRLKKVEDAVRSQEEAAWSRSTGTVATDAFAQALERLEAKRDAATARGDAKAAAEFEAQISSTRALMGQR